MKKLFVIIKRGSYWRPNSRGYTCNRQEAGFYELEEAKEVCEQPRSDCSYKPVSELFRSEAEVDEIIAHLDLIKEQMRLSESEVTK